MMASGSRCVTGTGVLSPFMPVARTTKRCSPCGSVPVLIVSVTAVPFLLGATLVELKVMVPVPDGIEFEVPAPTQIVVRGNDKQAVGEIAAKIRKIRKPEPYKGKGIRYEGEYVRKKAGKAAKTGAA